MVVLPNLPLLQERFYNKIQRELCDIKYPTFEVVAVFAQVWGSTALGFGGIGGQAITKAYTTVITNEETGIAGVFFSEQLAYVIKKPNENFYADVTARMMCAVGQHGRYEQ